MSHEFRVTNPISEKQKTLTLENTVQSALTRRHVDGVIFYHKDVSRDTMARHLGLNYPNFETMRRSPEFGEEVTAFIVNNGLEDSPELREDLGVMGSARQLRPLLSLTNRSMLQEVGKSFTDMVIEAVQSDLTDETEVTPEYIRTVLSEYTELATELPELPKKPVKAKALTKTQKLQAQIIELTAELEAAQAAQDASTPF